MAHIRLRQVRAEYQLLSVHDYNLKRQLLEVVRRRLGPPPVVQALNGVDMELPEGTRLGLVGANGSGKSTLLSVMAGLLPPTGGDVDITGRVLALLGGASAGLDQEATGRDNMVSMGVQLGETPRAMRQRMADITEFSGLGARIDHPVYSYSSGMQTRLRFSILTSLRPDILLIDEGIGTADAEFAQRAGRRLDDFVSSAGILVMASHGDNLLREQCDQALWLDHGIMASRGPIERVLKDYHRTLIAHDAEAESASALAPATLTIRTPVAVDPAPSSVEEQPAPTDTDDIVGVPAPACDVPLDIADIHERVQALYRSLLGRPADEVGLDTMTHKLARGGSFEDIFHDIVTSPEFMARPKSWGGVDVTSKKRLSFTLSEISGASHLLVTFAGPGLGTLDARGDDEHQVPTVKAHRLVVGAKSEFGLGAVPLLGGGRVAVDLIHREAERLKVSLGNIVCYGHSLNGARALYVGLQAGAGRVLAGNPPVKLGTWVRQLAAMESVNPAQRKLVERLLEVSRIESHPENEQVYNALIPEAARRSPRDCRIDLFVSSADMFVDDSEYLAAQLSGHPRIRCRLHRDNYASHENLPDPFDVFCRKMLGDELGVTADGR